MHRGVQQLIRWVGAHRESEWVSINAPATNTDLMALEAQLGVPLPADLKFVLARFNGGTLPSGSLLLAGTGPGTIEAALRRFAEQLDADFLDPELPLPYHRTVEGSWLCFDRSAGPVSDTWPIVDYYDDTGEQRLVYRTFSGWCRACVAEWESADFAEEFSLDKYLRQGQRHAKSEPDVSTAHATVAHAYRRAGEPERALDSYLSAARCVPALMWCDWEALKLAALLRRPSEALEAATRLCSRAPQDRWSDRETDPGRVADAIGRIVAAGVPDSTKWLRLLDLLVEQADEEDADQVQSVRRAVAQGEAPPAPRPVREEPIVPPQPTPDAWWAAARQAYFDGVLREEDLLLDVTMDPLWRVHDVAELLRIRRDF